MITQDELKKLIEYDPLTGVFTWKHRVGTDRGTKVFNTQYAGKVAGSVQTDSTGHKQVTISIKGVANKAHRLAWVYMTGEDIDGVIIDHDDCDPLNNRFANLRKANHNNSAHNKGKTRKNTSGLKGVSFKTSIGRWVAQISVCDKKKHIGYYDTPEEAHEAYKEAAVKYHGEFANFG